MSNPRTKQLQKRFNDIIHGNVKLEQRSNDCRLFLQGLCAQVDSAKCANDIVASPHGLPAVQLAMRSDLRPDFLNGLASNVLEFLLRAEMGGDVLNSVIVNIVDPPIFWNEFHRAFESGTLNERAERVFAKVLSYLLQMPNRDTTIYRQLASRPSMLDKIINSDQQEVRSEGYLIKYILSPAGATLTDSADFDFVPGGRHDNDFVDFREIAILPTADELSSNKDPALRRASHLEDPEGKKTRVADYLDNTFRLLRDDMMHELKEDTDIALKKKQGRQRGLVIDGIKAVDIYAGPENRRTRWGLMLQCDSDFPILKGVQEKDRKRFFLDDRRGSRMLRHKSLACLIGDGAILGLGTIHREEDLLAKKPPIIIFQIEGQVSLSKALLQLKTTKHLRLIQIDCAVFAFEPVLKALQRMQVLPLSEEILFWEDGKEIASPIVVVTRITGLLSRNPSMDLKPLLRTPRSIVLDPSQVSSLLAGLKQRVSLIQGPPGTGKSFIGALLAKALHMYTRQTILVVCYTNHALDQFLEDLIDIGIPREDIVRFGGRAKPALEDLSVYNLRKQRATCSPVDWALINEVKGEASHHLSKLQVSFTTLQSFQPSSETLLAYTESKDPSFFNAFRVPDPEDMMRFVGRNGKVVDETFLISEWMQGGDARMFKNELHVQAAHEIWNMNKSRRQLKVEEWKSDILRDVVEELCTAGEEYNHCQDDLSRNFGKALIEQLKSKRIIGCTTTGAAKFAEDIKAASPDVLLVEEAGEILESHVITALSSTTSQMILIGDHKQLRPKVKNYALTVEKGEGYDLNRSLFERLVLKGFPHVTLSAQHRMRPEISALIRALTYPDLKDAPKTNNRENIRGVQSNVIFVNHNHPEDEDKRISDGADGGSTTSKQNTYEVKMVLRIVRYLAQQGYGSDNIVILTPYLGQLSHLRDALKNETDPILNDLDSGDLSRAGLLTDADSKKKKTRIRLATIDNYQGEESDIVVASLCRSNPSNSIGFMDSPERLNVLISRARNGLILIGNSATFERSKKGGKLWTDFLNLMRKGGYVFEGFPVKCEKHPDKRRVMEQPEDFDAYAPDGGCTEPCGILLKCNVHPCALKCHPLRTAPNQPNIHATMLCKALLRDKCSAGTHTVTWQCHAGRPSNCRHCKEEMKRLEQLARRELEAKEEREAAEREHDLRMLELEAKLRSEREALAELQRAKDRENGLEKLVEDWKHGLSLVWGSPLTGFNRR
ncbi:P-loop containing nucleoside triphosphate hydrolase protein [Pisolithus croceorrhizus]|nr:P-loop containing nucleoside triphosphate hydrolase protein [Pisolithus croceorrhizus]KAI6120189.1 P-loop containing nucleoside triphosphate hydrolase protein [Pisolithus croceorrhizus]KAI6141136.1 P-loop containing nucleoside triphosphate hydrolase protein [Pisolithus thermaeus]